jgi:hypothetical protein
LCGDCRLVYFLERVGRLVIRFDEYRAAMGVVSNQVLGIIGTVLYIFIFGFSIWQLYLYCIPWNSWIFSTRKLFHFFLAAYCALQVISLYFFWFGEYYVKWTFACHLFANCCEVVAVSLVAVLWSKTLVSTNNAYKQVVPCLLVSVGDAVDECMRA